MRSYFIIALMGLLVGGYLTFVAEERYNASTLQQRVYQYFGEGDLGEEVNDFLQTGDTTQLAGDYYSESSQLPECSDCAKAGCEYYDGNGNEVPANVVRIMVMEHFVYLNKEDSAILKAYLDVSD